MEIRTPHTVTVRRPKSTKNALTNVTERDYQTPDKSFDVACMFQTRDGRLQTAPEGYDYSFDAYMHTLCDDLKPDDMVIANFPWLKDHFRIVTVSPKIDVVGDFSHFYVVLTRDITR